MVKLVIAKGRLQPPRKGWRRIVGGDQVESTYLWYGLASGTRSSYDPAAHSYMAFARIRGWSIPHFPAPSDRVSIWIAHEAKRIVDGGGALYKKSLKRKIQGLLSWHKDLGLDTSGVVSSRVNRVITGANKYHGLQVKAQPLPITLPILQKLLLVIHDNMSIFGGRQQALALIAAFTLGFACFMRMGELTYASFDERFDLGIGSVKLSHTTTSYVKLPASKTDVFRIGVTTTIPIGPADVCSVRALSRYLREVPPSPSGALFHLNNSPFTKGRVVGYLSKALMEAGYPAHRFSGHSLRRGAATWAASIGMAGKEIQTLGRWNSDCYKLYIDAGPDNHLQYGKRLLGARQSESTLGPSGIPDEAQVWRPAL
jgi:hypothetical protein